jgi:hypothetical protein
MDPDAALRRIDDADRVDAETREVMRGLHQWLSRGGFAPDWDAYPTGTRRYRKAHRKARAHATKKGAQDPSTSVVKLKDRYSGGHVWLTVRDGAVVGAMGSDPKRYVGMSLDQAKHMARYGGTTGKKIAPTRGHAVVAHHAGNGGIGIGDIVQRSDAVGKNRYVVVRIQDPWIYTRRISGSGAPGIITFPSAQMLKKVVS